MQLVQLDMKQISSEAEIYDCLVGQMNFTNADEKPESVSYTHLTLPTKA